MQGRTAFAMNRRQRIVQSVQAVHGIHIVHCHDSSICEDSALDLARRCVRCGCKKAQVR
jgi:hypothetical protein